MEANYPPQKCVYRLRKRKKIVCLNFIENKKLKSLINQFSHERRRGLKKWTNETNILKEKLNELLSFQVNQICKTYNLPNNIEKWVVPKDANCQLNDFTEKNSIEQLGLPLRNCFKYHAKLIAAVIENGSSETNDKQASEMPVVYQTGAFNEMLSVKEPELADPALFRHNIAKSKENKEITKNSLYYTTIASKSNRLSDNNEECKLETKPHYYLDNSLEKFSKHLPKSNQLLNKDLGKNGCEFCLVENFRHQNSLNKNIERNGMLPKEIVRPFSSLIVAPSMSTCSNGNKMLAVKTKSISFAEELRKTLDEFTVSQSQTNAFYKTCHCQVNFFIR